jgi:hypothetical protein
MSKALGNRATKSESLKYALLFLLLQCQMLWGGSLITYGSKVISKLSVMNYFVLRIGITFLALVESFLKLITSFLIVGFVVRSIVILPPIFARYAFGSELPMERATQRQMRASSLNLWLQSTLTFESLLHFFL